MTARCIDCHCAFEPRAHYEVRCFSCWREWKSDRGEYQPRPTTTLDPSLPAPHEWREMLPRLLMLAHPDRHGNSQMATLATQWLLEQRNRIGITR